MLRTIWIALLVLAGSALFFLAAFLEHDVSSQPARYGTPNELNLRLGDLQQTISAGSSKIFAGLCFVAAAVLFSAGGRRPGDQAPADPGAAANRPRE
jgi:hypothetical protein